MAVRTAMSRPEAPIALAVVVESGRVLLARRAVSEGSLVWVFPGGKVGPGESVEGAAVREALEETGVVVEAAWVLGKRVHPDTGWRVVYVACRLVAGAATPKSAREVSEVVWASRTELGELIPIGLFEPVQVYLTAVLDG
jgi:8-oxo-dGTP diphosphatase